MCVCVCVRVEDARVGRVVLLLCFRNGVGGSGWCSLCSVLFGSQVQLHFFPIFESFLFALLNCVIKLCAVMTAFFGGGILSTLFCTCPGYDGGAEGSGGGSVALNVLNLLLITY